MTKRLNLGLIYAHNDLWVGGSYYILNLIHALKSLPDEQRPVITVFHLFKEDVPILEATGYPHLQLIMDASRYSLLERAINMGSRALMGKNLLTKKHSPDLVDVIFPANDRLEYSKIGGRLYWIPDFQEHHLPEYFSADEIASRKAFQSRIAHDHSHIIFSSADAMSDFVQIYPHHNATTSVVNFAVTHPNYDALDIEPLKQKYALDTPYFMVPNQFWKHKNHAIILEALKSLDKSGFKVAFCGKEHDPRNPGYFEDLMDLVDQYQLAEQVRFLGFIDRKEQLKLMKHAIAIIQPSRFEGWSTVIEDAKAISQHVIASSLGVNREQLGDRGEFFDPDDHMHLGELMWKNFNQDETKKVDWQYEASVQEFGLRFYQACQNAVS